MNHTELPWKMEEQNIHTGSICTCHGDKDTWFEVWTQNWSNGIDAEANAAFIVKACNNHYKILDLLDEARLQIEYLHSKFKETGSGNIVLYRIEEAIKQVEDDNE